MKEVVAPVASHMLKILHVAHAPAALKRAPEVVEHRLEDMFALQKMLPDGLADRVIRPMPALLHMRQLPGRAGGAKGLKKTIAQRLTIHPDPGLVERSTFFEEARVEAENIKLAAPMMAREPGGGAGQKNLLLALGAAERVEPAALMPRAIRLPGMTGGQPTARRGLIGDLIEGAACKTHLSVPDPP